VVRTGYNQGIHPIRAAMAAERRLDYLGLVFFENSGRFGFAGRNFYTQFRVFADFLRNVRPTLERSEWPRLDEHVEMDAGAYLDWPALLRACRLPPPALKAHNLGITDLGWEGVLRLPPQARIRFPRAALGQVNTCLAGAGREAMFQEQIKLAAYRVKRGENLTSIAGKLGCSPFDLMQVNDIDREAASRLPVDALIQVPTRRYAELGLRAQELERKGRPRPRSFLPYELKRGEGVQQVQARFGLKHPELSKWNDTKSWKAGELIYVPEYD
jgi:membrane-bound lytic murein transglycosylase D